MNKDQERGWKKAEKESSLQRQQLLTETRDQVVALLKKSRDDISLMLSNQPTDYQQWRLSELNREIERVMVGFGQQAGQALSTAAGRAWQGGINAIEQPLTRIGINVPVVQLDNGQLMAMRAFMVDRIQDVGTATASRIKQELGLAMIGNQSIHDTISKVGELVDGGKARATTIVRTELSRAWAVASHERALESGRDGVPMDKIWRRSGKLYPRPSHQLMDGVRLPVHQAFTVNGHKIRFPHDPKAPASETINCGCICLYRPRDTRGTLSDHQPFTDQELAQNPSLLNLEKGKPLPELVAPSLRQTLQARGDQIANAPIEHLSAWSLDGKVLFSKTGDAASVQLSAGERAQLNDAVLLHNHPDGPLSFSPEDVKLAIWNDVAEMHVVDRLFNYEIVRPESANWGPAYWAKTLRPIVDRVTAEVKSQLDAAVTSGQIDDDQYHRLFDHIVWDRVNLEADLGYRRTLRTEHGK